MAEAIIKGLHDAQLASSIVIYDVDAQRMQHLSDRYGVSCASDNAAVVAACEVLILAIKPQQAVAVCQEIEKLPALPDTVVVSIMAGKTVAFLQARLPVPKCVRVMPNMPACVGQGMSALSFSVAVTSAEKERVSAIFGCVGQVVWVAEDKMDAVTALSGSGPAYIFHFAHILSQLAQDVYGFSDDEARVLVGQTFLGASQLLMHTEETPLALRKKVTSKGGTTAAALAVFESQGLDAIIGKAVDAACQRSLALSEE